MSDQPHESKADLQDEVADMVPEVLDKIHDAIVTERIPREAPLLLGAALLHVLSGLGWDKEGETDVVGILAVIAACEIFKIELCEQEGMTNDQFLKIIASGHRQAYDSLMAALNIQPETMN